MWQYNRHLSTRHKELVSAVADSPQVIHFLPRGKLGSPQDLEQGIKYQGDLVAAVSNAIEHLLY